MGRVAVAQQQQKLRVLGANIRRERLSHGLTQEKLAEMSDLNIRTLQKIEAGRLNILVTTLIRLREGIGCRWADLVEIL
jgi:transcriptional regulator with XRE-family HTH domain